MGDGAAKRVGLSLAQQAFVFPGHWLTGPFLYYAHLSARLESGLLDLLEVFLAVRPQLGLEIIRPHPLLLEASLHQFAIFNQQPLRRSNQPVKVKIAGGNQGDQHMRTNDKGKSDHSLHQRNIRPDNIVEKVTTKSMAVSCPRVCLPEILTSSSAYRYMTDTRMIIPVMSSSSIAAKTSFCRSLASTP